MRQIDDISDAFWECSGGVVFSLFHFSFDATLNNFFEETTPLFFVFFAQGLLSHLSLSALFFFSSSLGIHRHCTHTHARARKEEVILEALSSSSSSSPSSSPLSPPAWCEKRVK